ncbi:MAG: hypothetical protein A2X86_06835 [Bdellovibrionales bacterium GWA2_49_15]|nr:MAG: hypothetical protein A2X86_06835 [Bdellovibrionales bacterium GWA2_49_15]HAZ12010.1 hypothetical protein [Bdellovibrionales bacterium]
MAKLLFIDDDPDVHNLYGSFLRRRLHCQNISKYNRNSVTACENGPQAMALLKENPNFDLIVCDYCIPLKNGGDVWKYVRAHNPEIPFVLFTSQSLEELPEFDASFHGAGNVWLKKPAPPEKLLQIINSLLSEKTTSIFMS